MKKNKLQRNDLPNASQELIFGGTEINDNGVDSSSSDSSLEDKNFHAGSLKYANQWRGIKIRSNSSEEVKKLVAGLNDVSEELLTKLTTPAALQSQVETIGKQAQIKGKAEFKYENTVLTIDLFVDKQASDFHVSFEKTLQQLFNVQMQQFEVLFQRYFQQTPLPNASDTTTKILDELEKQVREGLVNKYLPWKTVKGLFEETSLELKPEYISLELLSDIKLKKKVKETEGHDKADATNKNTRNERLSSYEDLFGDRRNLALENLFKPDSEVFNKEELEEATTEESRRKPTTIVVHGRAGIGKTTLAKYISYAWAEGKQTVSASKPHNIDNNNDDDDDNHSLISPTAHRTTRLFTEFDWVFTLLLRELGQTKFQTKKQITLREWVYKSYFAVKDSSEKDFEALWKGRIESALQSGKGLIILDGYDELPAEHDCQDVLLELNEDAIPLPVSSSAAMKAGPSTIRKLITSRPHAGNNLKKHRRVEVIGFRDESIQEYVKSYFKNDKSYSTQLLRLLRSNQCLWSNAHIPITLNILCWVLKDQRNTPETTEAKVLPKEFETMTGLYEMMLLKLLARGYTREHEERRHSASPLKPLADVKFEATRNKQLHSHYALALQRLSAMAYAGVASSETTVLSSGCVEQALEKCHVEPEDLELTLTQLQGLGLLQPVLVDADGKPMRSSQQGYEFLHFTFQEFYAAQYIVNKLESADEGERQTMQQVVLSQKLNPRYQIVWWFVAGLTKKPESQERLIHLLRGDKATLESLHLIPKGKSIRLNHALAGDYELGLLVRCADEFEGAIDSPWAQGIIKQAQARVADLYRLFKKHLLPENFSSPFLSTLRISQLFTRLGGKRDLLAAVRHQIYGKGNALEDEIKTLLDFISQLAITTPWVLQLVLQSMRHEGELVRSSAVEAVGRLGASAATPEIMSGVVTLLGDEKEWVRRSAVEAVGSLGARAATPEILSGLVTLLGDEEAGVRENAVEAVGKIGESAATPEILSGLVRLMDISDDEEELYGEDGMNCLKALFALKRIGPNAARPDILSRLLMLLRSNEIAISRTVKGVVEVLGPNAATQEFLAGLLKLLGDKEDWVREGAVQVIGVLGTSAATPAFLYGVLQLLGDENKRICSKAAEVVGALGESAVMPEFLSGMMKLVREVDWEVRESVAKAVGALSPNTVTPTFLSGFLRLLDDEEIRVCLATVKAARALGSSVTKPAFLSAMLRLIVDKQNWVKDEAIKVLVEIGPSMAAPAFLSAILLLLADNNVCESAVRAVKVLGQNAARPAFLSGVLRLVHNKNESVRKSAAEAIGALGANSVTPESLSGLVRLMSDKSVSVRKSAVEAIEALGPNAATPEILSSLMVLMGDKNGSVLRCAAEALKALGANVATSEMLSGLVNLLEHKKGRIRSNAATAVGYIGASAATPEILSSLFTLLADEKPEIQSSAVIAVGKLGASAATPDILSSLVRLIVDSKEWYFGGRHISNGMILGPFVSPAAQKALRTLGSSAANPIVICALMNSLSIGYNDEKKDATRKLLLHITENHWAVILKALVSKFNEALSTEESKRSLKTLLSAIYCGAELTGSYLLQILWDSAAQCYYIDGYGGTEKVKIKVTETQARYFQECDWEAAWDSDTNVLTASHSETASNLSLIPRLRFNEKTGAYEIDDEKIKMGVTESKIELNAQNQTTNNPLNASSSTSTQPLSLFTIQLSELIKLGYRFRLRRTDLTTILIENTHSEKSSSQSTRRLLSLKDLFDQALNENHLENHVQLEVYRDSGKHTKVDLLCIRCDTSESATQVAKLLKQASGDYIRESLSHTFFRDINTKSASTSDAECAIQCALQ